MTRAPRAEIHFANGKPEIPPNSPVEVPPVNEPPDIPPDSPVEEPAPPPEVPPGTPLEVPPGSAGTAAALTRSLTLTGLLLVAACAVSPEAEERRRDSEEQIAAILEEPLDMAQYGETRRCLSDHEIRNFKALDDKRIVFEGSRGRLWLNTLPVRCTDLRHATSLRIKSLTGLGSRLCDKDSFQAGAWFDWPWYRRWPWYWGRGWDTGMICHLGRFQPVTEGQVAAIERAIRLQ